MQPNAEERRKQTDRRKDDKRIRAMVTETTGELSNRVGGVEGWQQNHDTECTQRYVELRDTVKPMAEWFQGKMAKDKARDEFIKRMYEFLFSLLKKGFEEGFGKVIWAMIAFAAVSRISGLSEFLTGH